MLNILGVSRSGFVAWKTRVPSALKQRKERVIQKMIIIYNLSDQNYGAPKITKELKKSGENICEKTVGNYMREIGIKAQWIKKFRPPKSDKKFAAEYKNLLNQNFNPERPDAAWCSDITYIWTAKGFVYLTSIMDLYSRKIIAWTLSETLEASYVAETVERAKQLRNVTNPLIMHSDRGVQYTSEAYLEACKGLDLSYSKKGYPYDNACIESFHSLIKREWLNRFFIRDYEHARALIFEYIETFYNTRRIHSHCDFVSPTDYEKLFTNSKPNCTA